LGGQPKATRKGAELRDRGLPDVGAYRDRAGSPVAMIRPKGETTDAITILGEYFGAPVNNPESIDMGQMSRFFSFSAS
jgi:hypothetical protein